MEIKNVISEKEQDTRLCKKIYDLGGMCIKLFMGEGLPDRLILLPNGVMAFAEIKRPTGKTSKLQDLVIDKIRKLGFKVYVVKNEQDIKELSRELCATRSQP